MIDGDGLVLSLSLGRGCLEARHPRATAWMWGLRSKDLGRLRALAILQFKPHCRSGTLGASRYETSLRHGNADQLITVVVADALCGRAHLTREDAVPPRLTQRALTSEVSDDRYWSDLDESRAPTIAAWCAERERESPIATGESPHQFAPLKAVLASSISITISLG